MSMLDLMTEEECLVAEAFFGFCWWCGARDDQPGDPAHAAYQAFMSGRAGEDPTALMSVSKHAELGSSPALALEILRREKTRLAEYVASTPEEKRWRPGMDVDEYLPAFVARGTDQGDVDARLAAARGLVFEAFHLGARTASMSGGRHDSGLDFMVRNAGYFGDCFQKSQFPVRAEELMTVIEDAASAAPGANGVFVVVPFVDEDDPANLSGVRESANRLVDHFAHESPLQLTAHVLDDRDLVVEIAQRLELRPTMAPNGIFVTIPLADPDNPDNSAGVLRNANRLVELLAKQDVPAGMIDSPDLVARVAGHLTSANA